MKLTIINIVAIVVSPIAAVLITMFLQSRKEKRAQKLFIFNTLISTRRAPINEETVRALNMIDVVFHDCSGIRKLWHEYFDMLNNQGLNNPLGWPQRQKKNLEMITEIAKVLGYGKEISHLDVDRVYNPTGLFDQSNRATEISVELLRVLKASGGLNFSPKPPIPSIEHEEK